LERQIRWLVLDPRGMRPRERAPAPELIPYVVAARAKFVRKLRLGGQQGKAIFVDTAKFFFLRSADSLLRCANEP
jgi:hypothetical protein